MIYSPNSSLSVIVPTLNEAGSVERLIVRIGAALKKSEINYEIVVVDDHSTDETVTKLVQLAKNYPVRVLKKAGKRGKAYSLLEGFKAARYDLVAMIDGDLQYPPEALPEMVRGIEAGNDVVLTRRIMQKTNLTRRLGSAVFHAVFTKALFNLDFDTQSGLKVFRRNYLEQMNLSPTPWSFDLEFIVYARQMGAKISSVDIRFESRLHDQAKVNFLKTSIELALASLRLKAAITSQRLRRILQVQI